MVFCFISFLFFSLCKYSYFSFLRPMLMRLFVKCFSFAYLFPLHLLLPLCSSLVRLRLNFVRFSWKIMLFLLKLLAVMIYRATKYYDYREMCAVYCTYAQQMCLRCCLFSQTLFQFLVLRDAADPTDFTMLLLFLFSLTFASLIYWY